MDSLEEHILIIANELRTSFYIKEDHQSFEYINSLSIEHNEKLFDYIKKIDQKMNEFSNNETTIITIIASSSFLALLKENLYSAKGVRIQFELKEVGVNPLNRIIKKEKIVA